MAHGGCIEFSCQFNGSLVHDVLESSNSGGSSPSSSLSPSSKTRRYAGGNPVCARPTPEWQKGISTFMKRLPDKEVKVEVENQPDIEVTEEAAPADTVGSSQMSSSSPRATNAMA